MTTTEQLELLVIGLGNVLCADDGVGVSAVRRLQRGWHEPVGVTVADGGTLGLSLLPYFQDARRLLILDAVVAEGRAPGSPVRLEGKEAETAISERLSPHQVGVADLLAGLALTDREPESVVLLGVVPASIAACEPMTAAVAAAIDALVAAALDEVASTGFPFTPRSHETQHTSDGSLLALGGDPLDGFLR